MILLHHAATLLLCVTGPIVCGIASLSVTLSEHLPLAVPPV